MSQYTDRIAVIKKEISFRYNPMPNTLEEFLKRASFPENTAAYIGDMKKLFMDIVSFYRNIRKVTEPDILLWEYMRESLQKIFDNYGHNHKKFWQYIKLGLGYDPQRPDTDWQMEAASRGAKVSIEKKVKLAEKDELKIDKQYAKITDIPKEDLDKILTTTPACDEEAEWLKARRDKYMQDFRFNASSDEPLLKQLLMKELILDRIDKHLKQYPMRVAMTNLLDDTTKTLCQIQSALGISREKRLDAEDDERDTIADLADGFDEYMENGADVETLAGLEILEMLVQKYDRGKYRGTQELSEYTFKCLTHGTSVEEAKKILADNKELYKELDEKCSQFQI